MVSCWGLWHMRFDEDADDWNFVRVDLSLPPLRWIANAFGSWGSYHLLKAFDAQDKGNMKLSDLHAKAFTILYKPYKKWGTYYTTKIDLEEDL